MDAALDAVLGRFREQQIRYPRGFPYNRNDLRLGIAAIQDEAQELLDEWRAGKKNLEDPHVRDRLLSEALDVAAAATYVVQGILDGEAPQAARSLDDAHGHM